MLNFTNSDKRKVNDAYKMILNNLKDYLKQYNVKDEIEYAKIVFKMLHRGLLSMNGTIRFDNNYNYFGLPIELSQGVQVMYGICCCRHATEFFYDLLCVLNINSSLIYFWVDNITGNWHRVNPAHEKANHQAILFNNEDKYIIDPANKFILQVQSDGQLSLLDTEYPGNLNSYQDENIDFVAKVLKKYYKYREFNVESVY